MAVAVKFRAPYIFHRDSALEVHAWERLVKVLCLSLKYWETPQRETE